MKPFIANALRVVLIGSITACTTGSPPPVRRPPAQQQLDEAQAESEHAYGRAQHAQQDASAKAAAAARADQDALRKQAEAQRAADRARDLHREAEQAQREAIRQGQEASAEALHAQERALSAAPLAEAQSEAMGATTSAEGTVETTTEGELVIARENAPQLRLRVDHQHTTVTRDGHATDVVDLAPGTPVTVTYRVDRDQPVAQTVETHREARANDR